MRFSNYFWISCYIIFNFSSLSILRVQSSSIDATARIGDFIFISDNVTIAANSEIEDFVTIDPYTVIGENTAIGEFSRINERCSIGTNVYIGQSVRIASRTTIDNNSKIDHKTEIGAQCSIGKNVTIGNDVSITSRTSIADNTKVDHRVDIGGKCSIGTKVTIQKYSRIGNNCTIRMGFILGKRSSIASNVEIDEKAIVDKYTKFDGNYIGKRAYVGIFSSIGSKSRIGELAVIHEYVSLPSGTIVKPSDIVIQTPTSLYLYKLCARNISSNEILPEFNENFRDLIEKEMQILRSRCLRSNSHQSRPKNLPKMISMYLIRYDGAERFNYYLNGIQGSGKITDSVYIRLLNEQHFCDKATKNILEPDTIEKFVQLLTIDLDAKRELRVEGDQFCRMFNEIQNKQRNIILADVEIPDFNWTIDLLNNN